MSDEDIKSLLEEIQPVLNTFKIMLKLMVTNNPQENAERMQHIDLIENLQKKVHKQITKRIIFY